MSITAGVVLRARWVVPVDKPPIDGGYIVISAGGIISVGPGRPDGGPLEDLGDVIVLPGLVNAHTHLEFSDLAAPIGAAGMRLPAWIRLVIAERKPRGRDSAAAIASGLAESLAGGVTTLGEISTAPAEAYVTAGARPTSVAFQEVIGFSAARVDSVLGDAERRLNATASPAGLSPHAPYSVHPRLVERLVELARRRNLSVAMHLAESLEELQLLAAGDGEFRELLEERSMWDPAAIPQGSRPLDYLKRLAEAPRTLVIHGNYLADDEISFLGQRRQNMSVVYCPRTHARFGHPRWPLAAMAAAGVRVALGTDSRASNPDLNLLAELRFAARLFPEIDVAAWVRVATLDAATALGLGDEVGSLTSGKRADLIAIPCRVGARDPYETIVDGQTSVERIWLGGKPVDEFLRNSNLRSRREPAT
jgi:cytosine/adenosine deaminase-related metal-dependent hydrolase